MSKIKNFFRRLLYWFNNNVWLQLVLIVSSIFGVIFTLPIMVKKIKEYRKKRQDPAYFYARYQVPAQNITQTINNLKNQNEKKLIMLKPKQNNVADTMKNSLATFVKQQKITFQVIAIDEQKFSQLYNQHYDFFNDITNQNQYLDSCPMPTIDGFEDFLTNPVLILWHQKHAQQIISNICGDNDQQKVVFLKRFWNNKLN